MQFKRKLCDLTVQRDDTIAKVKSLITEETGIPSAQLAIVIKDKQMIRRRAENASTID